MMKDRFALNKLHLKGRFQYLVMVSPRPVLSIDEERLSKDDGVLSQKALPQGMKFNTVYFFNYEKEGDTSQSKKELYVCDIERVSIEKDGFSLVIQVKEKIYLVHFRYNWELLLWYEGLKNAIDL